MSIPSKTMGEGQTFPQLCQSSATNRRKSGVLEEVFPSKMQTEASENHTVSDSYEKAEIRKKEKISTTEAETGGAIEET